MGWEETFDTRPRASHAEVRDAALVSMGEGKRVAAPVRPRTQYVTDDAALRELHEAIGTP
jgi:hypothetical protein